WDSIGTGPPPDSGSSSARAGVGGARRILRMRRPGRGAGSMDPSSISELMGAAERGDRSAAEALFAALYAELHRLAKRELARQPGLVSLGATTLLHEAYLDVAG